LTSPNRFCPEGRTPCPTVTAWFDRRKSTAMKELAMTARRVLDDPLVRGAYQTYEFGTWLMSNRQNDHHRDLQPGNRK
jgi:hypothetical protein